MKIEKNVRKVGLLGDIKRQWDYNTTSTDVTKSVDLTSLLIPNNNIIFCTIEITVIFFVDIENATLFQNRENIAV